MPLCPFVKNTFICFDDVGALPVRKDRRIHSAGAALFRSPGDLLVASDASASEEDRSNDGTVASGGDALLMPCKRNIGVAAPLHSALETPIPTIASLRGSATSLAFDRTGCRLIQQAIDDASSEEAVELSSELQGHVRSAIRSPHANFVIQKMISRLPPERSGFIAAELLGEGPSAARHAYGCRVVCRLLERSISESCTVALVDEILGSDPGGLCRHEFGHHVAKSIMAVGSLHHKYLVSSVLALELPRYSRGRNASQVIEVAFASSYPEDLRCALVTALLAEPGILECLAVHPIGTHVVRAFLQCTCESPRFRHMRQQAAERLRKISSRLKKDRYGRRALLDASVVEELTALPTVAAKSTKVTIEGANEGGWAATMVAARRGLAV